MKMANFLVSITLFAALMHSILSLEQEIVATKAEADYAILTTRLRLFEMEDNEAGDSYEIWGNFRVQHNDYIMARTNVGSPSSHMICPKSNVGGPRDWFGDLTQAAIAVGAGIATGGSATSVIVAEALVSAVSQVTSNVQQSWDHCNNGYIATASYPVSIGTNTLPYNFVLDLREDDRGEDDVWQFDTKIKNWSELDECWGEMFDPSSSIVRQCNYHSDFCHTESCTRIVHGEEFETRICRVSIETAILAWVKGPLVDGEVQDFDSDGNTFVTRESFYGPSYGVHVGEN